MNQLSMFDAPASAKPPKPSKYATSSTRPGIVVLPSPKDMLPTKPKELIELIRSELVPAYDVAVTLGNAADQVFLRERIRACVQRHGSVDTVLKAVAAPRGKIPTWGQPGIGFHLRIGGCNALCDYSGAISWSGYTNFSTHVPSEGDAFYSPTGCRTFSFDVSEGAFIATSGLSLEEWLVEFAENELRADGPLAAYEAPFIFKVGIPEFDLRCFTPKSEVA